MICIAPFSNKAVSANGQNLVRFLQLEATPAKLLKVSTIVSLLPITMFLPNAIALSTYVMQKASFMGAQGSPAFSSLLADGAAGVLIGVVVVGVSGFLLPWIVFAAGTLLKVMPISIDSSKLPWKGTVSSVLISTPS